MPAEVVCRSSGTPWITRALQVEAPSNACVLPAGRATNYGGSGDPWYVTEFQTVLMTAVVPALSQTDAVVLCRCLQEHPSWQ